MQQLMLLGLNHSTAPLAVRERVAFSAAAREAACRAFRARFPHAELVILSTCNRVELYTATAQQDTLTTQQIGQFLVQHHGITLDDLQPHLYVKTGDEVVTHLFRVASSLDSMVLGETQILGQVREAYESAHRLGVTGSIFHPLFQRAISVGKQVLTQTPIAEGRLSIASVAVEHARRIFQRLDDKVVLSVGVGKMGLLVLRHFAELSPGKLMVCTRDSAKGAQVAAEYGGVGVPMDDLADSIAAADVVVCSTGAPQPIITREMFEQVHRIRRGRPIFLIDIALPRDIDERVGDFEDAHLYNLDDLQQAVGATRDNRQEAISAAEALVRKAVEDYAAWQRSRQLGPLIERLYERYHRLAREEVDRTLARMPDPTPDHREHLTELARRLVNKMLHQPVKSLRRSGNLHGPAFQYLHAMEKLFQLDQPLEDAQKGAGKAGFRADAH